MNMRLLLAITMLITMATAKNLGKTYPRLLDDNFPDNEDSTSCTECNGEQCCDPNTCYNNFCYAPIVPVSNDIKQRRVLSNADQELLPKSNLQDSTSCTECNGEQCCDPNTCYNNFCYAPIVPVSNDEKQRRVFSNADQELLPKSNLQDSTSCTECNGGQCCDPNTCYNNFCYAPIVPVSNDIKQRRVLSNADQELLPKSNLQDSTSCTECNGEQCCDPNTCYNNFCYQPIVPVSSDDSP